MVKMYLQNNIYFLILRHKIKTHGIIMKFSKIASALLIAGMASSVFALDGDFALKGNVQTQVTKSLSNDSTNFSSGWIRANIGGQYKSESLDGTIMIRMFAPEFGNSISGKNYDRILADLYWVNYKWKLGETDKMNLKIGRWKTDWSQGSNFGTYIDKDLTKRGLMMRDYSHNALELGWIHGLSQLDVMLGTMDGNANKGYLRAEETMKFTIPLEMKVGYRGNLIDRIQRTAYLTHRVGAYASYSLMPSLRMYGEYACIYTQDEDIDTTAHNYETPDSKYFKPGIYFQPFYLGLDIAPKTGIMNTLMSNLMVEWEYIDKRDNLYAVKKHTYDEWAWTVAYVKKIGSSKIQFSVYSENELSDVALAFRLSTTIK